MQNISDIQAALEPVFDDYDISRAVLFGFLAKGTATENSGIDLLSSHQMFLFWNRSERIPKTDRSIHRSISLNPILNPLIFPAKPPLK